MLIIDFSKFFEICQPENKGVDDRIYLRYLISVSYK